MRSNWKNTYVTGLMAAFLTVVMGPANAVEWNWTGSASFEASRHVAGKEVAEGAGLQETDLEMEHVHLKITADLSDRFSVIVAPCLSHHETLSLKLAYLEVALWEDDFETLLSTEIGRFLVPFGRFNYLGEANNYPTISRPMLFASHDQDIIMPDGYPHPVFMSEYTEVGATLNGNKWFDWLGAKHQIWYGAWVGNGMYSEGYEGHEHGAGDEHEASATDIAWLQDKRFASDNNNNKAVGGRLSYSAGELFTVGGSYMQGKYDPEATLEYSAAGVDASIKLYKLQLDAEYVDAPTEFSALESAEHGHLNTAEYTTKGYYIQARYPFAEKWEAVAMYDILERDGPALGEDEHGGEHVQILEHGAEDVTTTINKISFGINYALSENVTIKTEFANFSFDEDSSEAGHDDEDDHDAGGSSEPDDVQRLSMAMVLTF